MCSYVAFLVVFLPKSGRNWRTSDFRNRNFRITSLGHDKWIIAVILVIFRIATAHARSMQDLLMIVIEGFFALAHLIRIRKVHKMIWSRLRDIKVFRSAGYQSFFFRHFLCFCFFSASLQLITKHYWKQSTVTEIYHLSSCKHLGYRKLILLLRMRRYHVRYIFTGGKSTVLLLKRIVVFLKKKVLYFEESIIFLKKVLFF